MIRAASLRWLLPVVLAYLLLILAGYGLLRLPGSLIRGNELSHNAATFMAVNAVTLTGFDPATTLQQYHLQGRLVVLGLMVAGSLMGMLVGGIALARILGMDLPAGRIVRFVLGFYLVAVLAGSLLLMLDQRPPLEALFLAVSALGNVGLAIRGAPAMEAWPTHAVLLPLAVLGGLGTPVLIDLWDRLRRHRPHLSSYSLAILAATSAIYLAGVGVMAFAIGPLPGSATVLNARTAGFTFTHAPSPQTMLWLVMLVMAVGGGAAGTAGGITLTALAALWCGVRRSGAGTGRALAAAIAWIILFAFIVTAAHALLIRTEPQAASNHLLFIALSAASNTGLSFGTLSLSSTGMLILALTMLLPRLLPLLLLLHLAERKKQISHR